MTVNLANLVIRNLTVGSSHSVGINGGLLPGSLTVRHCTVDGFETGIFGSGDSVLIADTFVTHNTFTGTAIGYTVGTLDYVVATTNNIGVQLGAARQGGGSMVTAVDTIAGNNGTGFDVGASVTLFLARSTATSNSVGVNINQGGGPFPSGRVESFGDNHIKGNTTDVKGGSLTNVGTQ